MIISGDVSECVCEPLSSPVLFFCHDVFCFREYWNSCSLSNEKRKMLEEEKANAKSHSMPFSFLLNKHKHTNTHTPITDYIFMVLWFSMPRHQSLEHPLRLVYLIFEEINLCECFCASLWEQKNWVECLIPAVYSLRSQPFNRSFVGRFVIFFV